MDRVLCLAEVTILVTKRVQLPIVKVENRPGRASLRRFFFARIEIQRSLLPHAAVKFQHQIPRRRCRSVLPKIPLPKKAVSPTIYRSPSILQLLKTGHSPNAYDLPRPNFPKKVSSSFNRIAGGHDRGCVATNVPCERLGQT